MREIGFSVDARVYIVDNDELGKRAGTTAQLNFDFTGEAWKATLVLSRGKRIAFCPLEPELPKGAFDTACPNTRQPVTLLYGTDDTLVAIYSWRGLLYQHATCEHLMAPFVHVRSAEPDETEAEDIEVGQDWRELLQQADGS